ncbi:4-alpha-glucanotransferase [Bacteroidota bacterium]
MIKVSFKINYLTVWGQMLYICGSIPELGNWDLDRAVKMSYQNDGDWSGQIKLKDTTNNPITYKYFLKDQENQVIFQEWGKQRSLFIDKTNEKDINCLDYWRPGGLPENSLMSSAFTNCLWSRNKKKTAKNAIKNASARFAISAPRVDNKHAICITGSDKALGEWDPDKIVMLDDSNYPLWSVDIALDWKEKAIQYKYGIYDLKEKKLVSWENGDNRILDHDNELNCLKIITDEKFRYPSGYWRGTGVAIPVFSLRTKNSFGVGEFLDIKLLVDWAVKAGLKLVQILPVNDTIVSHKWTDSYPYAAISVYALHPMYLNLPAMGTLKSSKEMDQFIKDGKKLNKNEDVDYESMIKLKSKFYKRLYDETRDKFLKDPGFKKFFKKNKDWLVPYAAFSCLRDRYNSADFNTWPEYAVFNQKEINRLTKPDGPDYDDIAVHYFIQYHLFKQLSEASEYARENGVILKGDLPIGIFRNSTDAWVNPGLYHMDKQAGAPPDDYAVAGQNWRFPTYNWEVMAKDGYQWWKDRLTTMGEFFDAYRIDHILGFFRIWEIPNDQVEGLMGRFNPAIPMHQQEFEERGLNFNYNRHCRPYIKEYMVDEIFEDLSREVKNKYLDDTGHGLFNVKADFDTQKKVEGYFETKDKDSTSVKAKKEKLKHGLYTLIGNVLFFEEPGSNKKGFHPKIGFHQTYSYRELDDHSKHIINEIYVHYFYERQENFWRDQALIKLPAITLASDMLVCGEDLGMVPACVPGVMAELGILRLDIQRMPKGTDIEFDHPGHAPYMAVVSPSCHDMSTVRGWWEEDTDRTQRYYNQILGHDGKSPDVCEPWISQEILVQHLYSPAMWAIFPIQDLVAIESKLRKKDPNIERINIPANPNHYWKYRFHINMEDLLKENDFNKHLKDLVTMAGRNEAF